MEKYISKATLVAEIERLKDEYLRHSRNKFCAEWSCGVLDNLLSFLDTLEVKEVDLESEYENFVVDDPILSRFIINGKYGRLIAKHFFELGIKAKDK